MSIQYFDIYKISNIVVNRNNMKYRDRKYPYEEIYLYKNIIFTTGNSKNNEKYWNLIYNK